jgi:hypothetical protein
MANRYWNPSADANWADANVWATTFNGDPTGVATPTLNDDVYFSSTNSHKCSIVLGAKNCNNIDFTYGTGYIGEIAGDTAINIYGSLSASPLMTYSCSGNINLVATSGTNTITGAGITFQGSIFINGVGGTFNLLSDLKIGGTRSFGVNGGAFNANNFNIYAPNFNLGGSSVRSIIMGNGIWNVTGASSGAWLVSGSNLTVTPNSSIIKFTDTTNSAITFVGGSKTYNNVYFSRGASTGNITITGANTFNDFKDDGTAAHSILFTNGTTQTITTMEVSGTAGNLHTLSNSSGTTVANLTTASAQISNDYLNIAYLNVTPANVWYAGANSHNTGGADTNWIFTAPPLPPFTGASVAGIDENGRQTVACVYNGDGKTIVPLWANPSQHALIIDDNTAGSDAGNNSGNAQLDDNSRQVWTVLSSAGDGTIVEVYANSSNQLLINSN